SRFRRCPLGDEAAPPLSRDAGFIGSSPLFSLPGGLMNRSHCRLLVAVALTGAALFVLSRMTPEAPAESRAKSAPEGARDDGARDPAKVREDLYKPAVPTTPDPYVQKQADAPAAKVAKKIFQQMKSKGWPSARLVDATGEPVNRGNLPKTAFEKAA